MGTRRSTGEAGNFGVAIFELEFAYEFAREMQMDGMNCELAMQCGLVYPPLVCVSMSVSHVMSYHVMSCFHPCCMFSSFLFSLLFPRLLFLPLTV